MAIPLSVPLAIFATWNMWCERSPVSSGRVRATDHSFSGGFHMNRRFLAVLLAVLTAFAMISTSCSSKNSSDTGGDDSKKPSEDAAPALLKVPQRYKTIQAAVDAAKPGDMILINEGVYKEAVDVTTENLTIRGMDRNKVILDGEFKLENGIRVLDAKSVVIENMTARNYTSNGFFWTGVDGYRGSYLTAYRNGDYGIYAFDSYNGQIDNSYGSGSPDAGFYIGQCYPCNALIDNVVSEYNGLGYSGTNSGGDLSIVNSTFRYNRAGIVPNSGSYELCYPSRGTSIVGNLVYSNNGYDNPGISVSLLAQGNGILVAGAVQTDVERNRVWDHERTGIGLVPFPEEDANDLAPSHDSWTTPCSETRDVKVDPIPTDKCKSVDGLLKGCVVFWNPFDNTVVGNVVSESGAGDLAVGTVDLLQTGETTDKLNNKFCDNTFSTSAPANLEVLSPCDGTGSGNWADSPLDLIGLMGNPAPKPPDGTYKKTPVPEAQESMTAPETLPTGGPFTGPKKIDLAAIKVPDKPQES